MCGSRDLDPVEVLKVLNAQGWRQDETVTAAHVAIPDGALEDYDDRISTASVKIYEDPEDSGS